MNAVQTAANSQLPLSTLLSQVLVAFTIEFDNEFEHRMPNRTSLTRAAGDARDAPWLVSLVMWSNFMRLVGEEGVSIRELRSRARAEKLPLSGMQRWGYVTVGPDPADSRPKPPRPEWLVRPTAKGRRAQEVWRPLFGVIEERWEARFGKGEIHRLREALSALVRQMDDELPEYLPVLGYGMFAEVFRRENGAAAVPDRGNASDLSLPALLSRVLLAFTLDFEREAPLSLAMSANVMRLLGEDGVRVRDLPGLSGVSKEAIAMALGFLEKRHYVVVEPDPTAGRTKRVRLTPRGRTLQDAGRCRLGTIEARWRERFGEEAIRRLREALQRLVGNEEPSRLFQGLQPYPEGWRALVHQPSVLPHYPMVLHRGGYPDGS